MTRARADFAAIILGVLAMMGPVAAAEFFRPWWAPPLAVLCVSFPLGALTAWLIETRCSDDMV